MTLPPADLPLRDAPPGPTYWSLAQGEDSQVGAGTRVAADTLWFMGARIVVIDNYDSFVYNLVQELGELGASPGVWRNDAIDVGGIRR